MDASIDSAKSFLKSIGKKKTKDYTFLTIFFIVFSIFIVFAIRPSLTTALSLQKEEQDLKVVDQQYEQVISKIIEIQNQLQIVRDKLYLIDDALPEKPKINILVQDIQESANKTGLGVEKMNVGDVSLVRNEQDIFRSAKVDLETTSSFENLLKFEKEITQQRRLKKISALDVGLSNSDSSTSGKLKIKITIEGFYL